MPSLAPVTTAHLPKRVVLAGDEKQAPRTSRIMSNTSEATRATVMRPTTTSTSASGVSLPLKPVVAPGMDTAGMTFSSALLIAITALWTAMAILAVSPGVPEERLPRPFGSTAGRAEIERRLRPPGRRHLQPGGSNMADRKPKISARGSSTASPSAAATATPTVAPEADEAPAFYAKYGQRMPTPSPVRVPGSIAQDLGGCGHAGAMLLGRGCRPRRDFEASDLGPALARARGPAAAALAPQLAQPSPARLGRHATPLPSPHHHLFAQGSGDRVFYESLYKENPARCAAQPPRTPLTRCRGAGAALELR